MKVFAAVFLCVLSALEAKAQYSRCLNPNQRPGLCVHINECQTLYSVLNQARLTDLEKKFIKSSACGMGVDNRPFVCCTQDTGYQRNQRQTPPFADYDGFGGDWEEERPSSFAFPRQESRPWSFGDQRASDRTSVQRASTADGSNLLPQPPTCGGVAIRNRIYDGVDTDLNEFPWMVLLEYRNRRGGLSTSCAGSLINQRYVLTAAHCLTGRIERDIGSLVSVRLGEHDTRTAVDCPAGGGSCAPESQRLGFEEVRVHEKYSEKSPNQLHDIGLVRLDRNVRYSDSVRPICLPSSVGVEPRQSGQQFTVAGWGRTLQTARSPVKQKVLVNYVEPAKCRQRFSQIKIAVEATQLCAGGQFRQDSCDGDSGGPLMRFRGDSWVLEGIVSFGYKCGLKDWPGVYTNVAAYDIWIRQNQRSNYSNYSMATANAREIQTHVEPCLNPNQRDGFCVDINQCTTFWNRGRVRTPSERRFLEESKCDPHNPRHVCCTMDTDFFSDLSVCGGDRVKPNIITGVPAVRGEYSWMVLLEFLEEAIRCSGNLINPKYVLTAAHCLDKSPVSVILGVHEIHDVNIVRMEIEEIKIHERFSYSSGENDIGLIRLTGSVTYTAYIRPACLPSSVGRKQLQPGDQLSVAGWGATEYTDDQGKRLNSRIKLKTRISYADWAFAAASSCPNDRVCASSLQPPAHIGPHLTAPMLPPVLRLWVFYGCLYRLLALAAGLRECEIPNEAKRGVCLEVSRCAAYLQVRNATNLPAEKVNFLKKVQCEAEQRNPEKETEAGTEKETEKEAEAEGAFESLVCCPANGQDYLFPVLQFSKFEYRRFLDVTARFKRKKLKRRIQTVEPSSGFNLLNECGKQVTNRIYGGEIAELDEFPWLALLVYNSNDYGCSGALVDDRHILTAAHCVQGEGVRDRRGLKHVRLGEFNVKTEPDCIEEPNYLSCADAALNIGYERIHVHPEYKEVSNYKHNDIAIIRLKHPVSFTHFVMPICLPNKSEPLTLREGQMFSVSGWGRTDLFNKYFINIHSPIKLKLRIPFVSNENCTKILEGFGVRLGPKQICAGGEFAKDTCAGDSGGPLMYFDRQHSRWVAYGVVSYGFTQCGMAGKPAVYTNVAEYSDWIESVIQQSSGKSQQTQARLP
ncbi:uncharacterized protein LOC108099270 [Drosophila ficusphila]|uniref:uncharacterized protein LOC108099270 n=1 Tax=Drosophila ficusphila TaxID=30025 RepID=UPI001C891931|nr:uncharacterized protein LOC108099270 [Drosophila ficusphila]